MTNKVAVTAAEMDSVNSAIDDFHQRLVEEAPNVKLLGLIFGIPDIDGNMGVLAKPSPNLEYREFARVLKEMGIWMEKRDTQ